MGKKSKTGQPAIYIAPPSANFKADKFTVTDYDPQTQLHDPFEDDLDFLLKDDTHTDAIETTTTIDEDITIPIPKNSKITKIMQPQLVL